MRASSMRIGSLVLGMITTTPLVLSAKEGNGTIPVIPPHDFASGSAKVKITGFFAFDTVIPINAQASFGDGEMTWLQYGDSGSEAPNALVTVSLQEVGITVARGKPMATAGAEDCKGGMQVRGTSVTGRYQCPDVASYDPRTGKMGKVNVDIEFTAS